MKDIEYEKRGASFVCVLTAILENGEKLVCRGENRYKIARKCGTMGKLTFGPVLIPDGFNKVMNDLSEDDIADTHRHRAWRELLTKLK